MDLESSETDNIRTILIHRYAEFLRLSDEELILVKRILFDDEVSRKKLLHSTPWGITKTDLLIKKLRDEGIISVLPVENDKKGRRPLTYRIRKDLGFFLGVEVNIAYDRIVMIGMNGERIAVREYASSLSENAVMDVIDQHIRQFLSEQGVELERVWAVGVGTHASFEDSERIVRDSFSPEQSSFFSNHAEFFPLKHYLEQQLNVPVFLERPKLLVTIPYHRRKVQQLKATCVSVNIGYGAGMAIFIEGRYYPGSSNLAGEIGHLVIPGNTKLCYCGNYGCLQTVLSYKGICEEALRQLQIQKSSGILSRIQEAEITGPDYERGVNHIIQMALENDKACMGIIMDIATTLGTVLASIVSLFNPDMVTIFSLLVKAGDLFAGPLKMAMQKNTFSPSLSSMETELVPLQPYAVATGGAFDSREECFHLIETMRIAPCGNTFRQ